MTSAGVRRYRQWRQPCLGALLANRTPHQVATIPPPRSPRRWYHRLPVLGDTRRQHLARLAADADVDVLPRQLSPEERNVNQRLAVAVTCLGLTSIGAAFYPPLGLLALPGLIYLSSYAIIQGIRVLVVERRIVTETLDVLIMPLTFLTGQLFATSVASVLWNSSRKFLVQTEDHSCQSLVNVFNLQPRSVWLLVDGVELDVPVEQVQPGDIVVVHAGQTIPVDGVIVQGEACIDQRMLTGEAQPADRCVGDAVFAATILLSGSIQIQVEHAGHATVAASIGDILNETAGFKLDIQTRSMQMADQTALPTLVLFLLAIPVAGLANAVGVLWSSMGYTMRLTAPLCLLNYLQVLSQHGILIKDGRSLEALHQIDMVVFDKTGTLTEEQPHVSTVHSWNGLSADEVLAYAAAAEYKQTHPIARSILQAAAEWELAVPVIDYTQYAPGYGLIVQVAGQTVRVGSQRFLQIEGIVLPADVDLLQDTCHNQGYSLVYVALDDTFVGVIELHPTIRPEARQIIAQLHQRGMQTCIISGDQEQPTRRLAQELGIDSYFAGVLPEDKASLVQQLQTEGKHVCFVGDGINDAIALKQARVSISLRGASTIATDTAQIVMMDGSLRQLGYLFNVASDFERSLHTSQLISLVPGMVTTGGVFLLHWGVPAAIALFNAGLVIGMVHAMLPVFKSE